MTFATDSSQVNTPVDLGQVVQVELTPVQIGLALSIAGSGASVSNIVLTNGYKAFAFGCLSTQNGTISIQRYLDDDALIPQGAAITANITGNTAQVANANDGHPFQSIIVTVNNSSGSPATLTNTVLLLQAN